jgi:orotate phosphoribosyltransferase
MPRSKKRNDWQVVIMNDSSVQQEFEAADAILKGHFILSSGLHSDTYLQCARVLMDTNRAERLCAALAEKVRNVLDGKPIDMVVAPAMGGVVVGYEMGRQLNVPTIFCERVDGKFTLRRGFEIPENANILLVEDVVTTGKSSLETAQCIKDHGGRVAAEACLVDRSNGTANLGFPLAALIKVDVKTFDEHNVPEHLKDVPAVKPGSRWLQTNRT